jgi:hypothetical protein
MMRSASISAALSGVWLDQTRTMSVMHVMPNASVIALS